MARRKAKDPQAEYERLEDFVKQAALVHAEGDAKHGRGWVCQCGACRLVRTALYGGMGNAVRP